MNREILFRGKQTDNGEWIYGGLIVANGQINPGKAYILNGVSDFSYGDNGNRCRIGCFVEVDPSTVCEYTGLADLCGTKVFENDIIKYSGTGAEVYGVIRYGSIPCDSGREENTGFYIEWQNIGANEWNEWYRHDLKFWINEVSTKIVGNIFDNPELLEENNT